MDSSQCWRSSILEDNNDASLYAGNLGSPLECGYSPSVYAYFHPTQRCSIWLDSSIISLRSTKPKSETELDSITIDYRECIESVSPPSSSFMSLRLS